MDLILSPKDWTGDVPVLNCKTTKYLNKNIDKFIDSIDFEKSVVVVFFQRNGDYGYRNEHQTLLVTTNVGYIRNFISEIDFRMGSVKCISIFEFSTYKEAFEYCIDLKEGL